MKVALTGHRPQRLGLPEDELDDKWLTIARWLHSVYMMLNEECEEIDIYCGMASGCDIKFGLTMIQHDNVNLHCVLPCKGYNSKHQYFKTLKEYADEWIELSDEFYKGCDNVRDQYMVDHCDILLTIWDGNKSGGVWSTIRKAQKAGKKIIYIPTELLK